MTFSEPDRGRHAWTLLEASSRPLIQQALDAGINFFDTANSYSDDSSEEIAELETAYQPHPVVGFE